MSSGLQVVVVAAHTMVTTSLDVNRRQVKSKRIVPPEEVSAQLYRTFGYNFDIYI